MKKSVSCLFIIFQICFLNIIQAQTKWQNITEIANFNSVCFGNGIFVTVGNSGKISTSSDGVSWQAKTSGTTESLKRIEFLNSTFIAIGDFGTILTSTDANNWTVRNSGTTKDLYGISYGAGKFVAVGNAIIVTSVNGSNWATNAVPNTDFLRDVAFGNGKFVATGNLGVIKTSTDGLSWSAQISNTTNALNSVIYQNSLFVAVGNAGTILTSTDGVSWFIRISNVSSIILDITYGASLYVACGQLGNILTSPNGINWTLRSTPNSQFIDGIAFGNNLFSAVLYFGITQVSVDGINWSSNEATLPYSNYSFFDITYNGQFTSLTNNGMLNSADGINWVAQTSFNNSTVNAITYDNNSNLFGVTSTGNVLKSTVNNQWGTPQNINGQSLYDIAYGNGIFVVGSNFGNVLSGTGTGNWNSVFTGPQGLPNRSVAFLNGQFVILSRDFSGTTQIFTTATGSILSQKTSISNQINSITYGDGKYVAASSTGNIYTSPDLLTWTIRTSGTTRSLNSICFGFGYFVAVGETGTIITSPDGINWTRQTSYTTNGLVKVIPASGIGSARVSANPSFVAVGANTILFSSAGSSPLPLNLISFTGKNTEKGNELTWKTTDEKAFSHFEIERSNDAKKFEKIGELTSNKSEFYAYLDNSPNLPFNSSIVYYRLKMVDLDGNFKYSKIINIDNAKENLLKIYPNPSTEYFRISNNEKIESIEIMDFSGKIIRNNIYKADNQYDIKGLAKGVYFVKMKVAERVLVSKLVKN